MMIQKGRTQAVSVWDMRFKKSFWDYQDNWLTAHLKGLHTVYIAYGETSVVNSCEIRLKLDNY